MDFQAGHVKHNPETGEIALRTSFPESLLPNLAWLVSTLNLGARNARTADVADWADLFIPQEGS